jgi:phosphatidylserine synthase
MIAILAWILAFVASLAFLFVRIIDYKKTKKSKIPIIVTAIASFIFGLPIIITLILMIGLSTGLLGM